MSPAPIDTSRARLMALMYPKEGVSFEQFDAYWSQEHSKLFTSLDIVKKNLTTYEQYHLHQPTIQILTAQGVTPVSFYGVAIFEAVSMEKVLEVFTSDEYNTIVVPDEDKFFDRTKTQLLPGYLARFVEDSTAGKGL
ncbi:hypothetical protein BDY19DRAFT_421693 [Irpex rosettiformis]|uniref:Uncharacterized protein n=1 Tax=Irpex rosettiformis TaxID=378272 RepID=A0ACB8UG70_9APHY|nr:hypothetical protein BDY19DRAFT_421693 [Irpex rosettiformis]